MNVVSLHTCLKVLQDIATTTTSQGAKSSSVLICGPLGCGNSIQNGGVPATDGCNAPCNGNAAETCGGSNRLTVFTASGATGSGTGKRGLCYNNNNPHADATYANLFKGYQKVSWAYDWGYPSWGLDSHFEL